MSGFVSKLADFFRKRTFFACFFSLGCHEIIIIFIFFSPICEGNPAIPLCRTGVGSTPSSKGRIAVSHDKNEHFFEKTDKNSAPFDISEKPKNRQKMLFKNPQISAVCIISLKGGSAEH